MQNPCATTSLKLGGRDVNIAKYLSQMNIGHHRQKWKLPILGVARIVLQDVFLASIFLAFFPFRAGKFSSAAPTKTGNADILLAVGVSLGEKSMQVVCGGILG
jgi:hypothetical protein